MNTIDLENQAALRGGALTLCVGEETGINIQHSIEMAAQLAAAKSGPVLYINTIQTPRRLGMSVLSVTGNNQKSDPNLSFFSCEPGLLSSEKGRIEQCIEALMPKTIIINSLDFASKDYRRKEELIFSVMEWLGRYDTNILIFSELRKSLPKPGKIQRGGGVGKLAAIAEEIRLVGETSIVDGQSSMVGKIESSGKSAATDQSLREKKRVAKELVREEIPTNGLRVRSTGIIDTGILDTAVIEELPPMTEQKIKHFPMSNKNRALLAEYEKIHGKAQHPGESFREMFDRVVGLILAEKAGKNITDLSNYIPDKLAIRNKRKDKVREMLTI